MVPWFLTHWRPAGMVGGFTPAYICCHRRSQPDRTRKMIPLRIRHPMLREPLLLALCTADLCGVRPPLLLGLLIIPAGPGPPDRGFVRRGPPAGLDRRRRLHS